MSPEPALALSFNQQFELERMNRVIDSSDDPSILRGLAKQLLQAWQSQKAAMHWIMRTSKPEPLDFGAMAREMETSLCSAPTHSETVPEPADFW